MTRVTAEGVAASLNNYEGDDYWTYIASLSPLADTDRISSGDNADHGHDTIVLVDGSNLEFDEATGMWYVALDAGAGEADAPQEFT